MLESVSREVVEEVSVDDLIALDHIHREMEVPEQVERRKQFLFENGIIERVGRGRGTRYLRSRRFYKHIDEPGVYTRKRGLDRDTNKQLLLMHIGDNRVVGSRFRELHQVLPSLSKYQVQTLLRELKEDQKIHSQGVTRAARWYPGPDPDEN
jgi:ATP-dependent DNA helicase RecG